MNGRRLRPFRGWFQWASSGTPGCGERAAASSVIFWLESINPEFLLQARGRGRVLEHQPLVRIDVAVCLLRHQRALVESGEDQLQLAGIGVDVTDRENAGYVGLERGGLDRHQ